MPASESVNHSRAVPNGVAVLIVNFKAYEHLRRCLRSLLPSLSPADEVVVIDQQSTDASLNGLASEFPAVRVCASVENTGFAAGVNLAARQTQAPFLLLLNPDTRLEVGVVDALRHALEQSPEAGVVGPRVVNDDGSIQASARRFPDMTTPFGGRTSWLSSGFPGNWFSARNLKGLDAVDPMRVDWISGACLMTRRDLFDRLGGLDEAFFLYWEDADYCRRVLDAGLHTIYVPTATVHHSVGASSSHNPELAIRAFHASALRMYRKHAGRAGQLATPAVQAVLLVRQQMRLRTAMRLAAAVHAHAPTPLDPRPGPIRGEVTSAERALG